MARFIDFRFTLVYVMKRFHCIACLRLNENIYFLLNRIQQSYDKINVFHPDFENWYYRFVKIRKLEK